MCASPCAVPGGWVHRHGDLGISHAVPNSCAPGFLPVPPGSLGPGPGRLGAGGGRFCSCASVEIRCHFASLKKEKSVFGTDTAWWWAGLPSVGVWAFGVGDPFGLGGGGSWGVVASAGPFGQVCFVWVWNYWWVFDIVGNKVKSWN